jgi:hypothetical protein
MRHRVVLTEKEGREAVAAAVRIWAAAPKRETKVWEMKATDASPLRRTQF